MAGFLLAWWMFSGYAPYNVTAFVFGLALVLFIRGGRNFYLRYESAKEDQARDIENARLEILDKETKKANAEAKLAEAQAKAMPNYLFTSEDFTEDARAILLKIVKDARRKKIPVTGQGLVQSILKSLR